MDSTQAQLVPLAGAENLARKRVVLAEGSNVLGRAPKSHVFLDDPSVSKAHAEIIKNGETFLLRDLGSANGTFVNGRQVKEQTLRPGDTLKLGSCSLELRVGDARPPLSVSIVAPGARDQSQVLATVQLQALKAGQVVADLTELRRRHDRVQAAFQAVAELIATTDIQALCHRILEVTFKLVSAESGAVLLFDEKQSLVPWAAKSRHEEAPELVVSRTIVEQVIRSRAGVLASDALYDSRFSGAKSVILSGVRSLICVPLLNADRIYGLLHVGNSREVAAFSAADLELITGLGAGAGVALCNAFMAHRLAEEARTRESLGRFLSPVLLEQVMQNRVTLKRGGEEREVTVLFADIRGFTALTERSKPQEVVSLLNECFDQMVEVVFSHSGVLDKYIGDALMAVWGTPVEQAEDAARALAAARDMQETLSSLNALRRDRSDEPVLIGIGLASGRCVSGAIGARRRLEYTVIGDAVNLASRLSGMARAGQVICDEETYRRAGKPNGSRELPAAQVKGKTMPVPVYLVHGQAGM